MIYQPYMYLLLTHPLPFTESSRGRKGKRRGRIASQGESLVGFAESDFGVLPHLPSLCSLPLLSPWEKIKLVEYRRENGAR